MHFNQFLKSYFHIQCISFRYLSALCKQVTDGYEFISLLFEGGDYLLYGFNGLGIPLHVVHQNNETGMRLL